MQGALGANVSATLADRDPHERLGLDPGEGQRLLTGVRRGDPRIGWAQVWSRFVLVEWYRRTELDRAVRRDERVSA